MESPEAGLKILKLITPIIPAMIAVKANTIIDMIRILPSFLELVIFAMVDEILKKTKGISKVNIKFKNISPNGAKNAAFEPISNPIQPPTSVAIISNKEDL